MVHGRDRQAVRPPFLSVAAPSVFSASGGNYFINAYGSYSIEEGVMRSVNLKPLMLVSDLDGTMVGDDVATLAFRNFWRRHKATTDSVLVYNTGRRLTVFVCCSFLNHVVIFRSLASFLRLLDKKMNCLDIPDALVCAVGTKIYSYHLGEWLEDAAWTEQLTEAWDLTTVQDATRHVVKSVGSENLYFRCDRTICV